MVMLCYKCGINGVTRVESKIGMCSYTVMAVVALLGCWLCAPCALCVDPLKDKQHFCANCHTLVAVKKAG